MYILSISQNGKLTTKIIDSEFVKSDSVSALEDLLGCKVNGDDEIHSPNTALQISPELLSLIMQAIRGGHDTKNITMEYELGEYEMQFIAKLVGNITNYAHLLKCENNCGKTEMISAGFWVKNTKDEWVAVERFCNDDIIMGYVKPAEIMQYLFRLECVA